MKSICRRRIFCKRAVSAARHARVRRYRYRWGARAGDLSVCCTHRRRSAAPGPDADADAFQFSLKLDAKNTKSSGEFKVLIT